MSITIKIEREEDGKKYGKVHVDGRSADITIWRDSSYEIVPAWMERNAITAAGSKGQFRSMVREAN